MENPYFKYDARFIRSAFDKSFKSHPLDVSAHVHEDGLNSYTLNSKGYRTAEFQPAADLVVAGCSFTFGSGVPQKARWGSVLARHLGVEEVNLGVCAWSTQAIIENIYAYIDKYGPPKTLVCLFPDPSRSPLVAVEGLLEYEDGFDGGRQVVDVMLNRPESYEYLERPKYSKRPHQIEDVIPIELPMYFYLKYVHMLEDYCRSLGVKFIWSTWDSNLTEYLQASTLEEGSPNYKVHGFLCYSELSSKDWGWDVSNHGGGLPADSLSLSKELYSGCHSEAELEFGDNFYIGSDVNMLVHWGVHKHLHVAESFLKSIDLFI
jgi:hypothetical protein